MATLPPEEIDNVSSGIVYVQKNHVIFISNGSMTPFKFYPGMLFTNNFPIKQNLSKLQIVFYECIYILLFID